MATRWNGNKIKSFPSDRHIEDVCLCQPQKPVLQIGQIGYAMINGKYRELQCEQATPWLCVAATPRLNSTTGGLHRVTLHWSRVHVTPRQEVEVAFGTIQRDRKKKDTWQ